MPEGDSVWRAAAQLHPALAGQQLTASDFRVPRFATLKLAGWTVNEVVPRGKHLLMRLQGPSEEKLTIHSHLKMEGTWQVYPPGGRWRKPGFTARCVLRTATADAVGFSLGILEVVRTADEDSVVGHLGPDLLGPDWDMARPNGGCSLRPDVPIGVALLDQRNLAGIGNIYRCEACFLSGIHPGRARLRRRGPARHDGRRQAVTGSQPGTGPAYHRPQPAECPWAGAGRPGYWVYGREHQPCLKCGTPIRRGVLGKTPAPKSGTSTSVRVPAARRSLRPAGMPPAQAAGSRTVSRTGCRLIACPPRPHCIRGSEP